MQESEQLMVRHIGVRPTYAIEEVKIRGRYFYYEERPDGTGKFWNKRELKSGCNYIVKRVNTISDLVYCSKCDEHFNKNQFVEVECISDL